VSPFIALLKDPGARANIIGLGVNILLAIAKFVIGVMAGSAALIADGFNSAGDIIATSIGFVGYQYARKPPDEDHHYGHGNAESIAGLIIGVVLFATGLYISIDGILVFLEHEIHAPKQSALLVAAFTLVSKEILYRYTIKVGEQLNSPSLKASARDHRADVFVAFTVIVGIIAARTASPYLDPAAAVCVGLYIAAMAIEPIWHNVGILMDKAPVDIDRQVAALVKNYPPVLALDLVRVQQLGSYYIVDIEIAVESSLTVGEAHHIAHDVADHIQDNIDHVRDVRVHVNPAENHCDHCTSGCPLCRPGTAGPSNIIPIPGAVPTPKWN